MIRIADGNERRRGIVAFAERTHKGCDVPILKGWYIDLIGGAIMTISDTEKLMVLLGEAIEYCKEQKDGRK